ncbi:MAG: U32 family peptidase [Spirochaetales bacterium]|nr:U32 family peptidase [Spirochaetales bacterium]
MPPNKPELLAPAGNFMAAWYAFAAGADAVYVGLRRFSARASAQNFSSLELAKLKAVAVEKNRKIYTALNTVIREAETDDFISALAECERLGVDGILVQDAGALAVAREHFPGLPVHASTQMALGNSLGLAEAECLGIRRVVLPRETSFEEVKALRARFPDLELEVFIHGALCYSYSGLCLASGLMGGGSGNRGACAQVCRLKFSGDKGGGHILSCRDLFSGPDARRLAEIGVDSLKIEGRLKPASYVYHTVRLYRFILDHPRPENEPGYRELLEKSGFVFARERTKGRLFGGMKERLITRRYERSVGFPAGRVERTAPDSFSFTASIPIALGDVLQVFLDERERSPYKLPVRGLLSGGKKAPIAGRGDFVTVASEKIPALGQEITKVYSKNNELPGVRHDRFAPYRKKLPVRIVLFSDAPNTMRMETNIDGRSLSFVHPCAYNKSERPEGTVRRVRGAFEAAEDPLFKPEVEEIRCEGSVGGRAPGSRQLKMIRDDFLRRAAEAVSKREAERRASIHAADRAAGAGRAFPPIDGIREFIRDRANLNPRVSPRGLIPFHTGGRLEIDSLARTGNFVFIPLHPAVGDGDREYYEEIDRFIRDHPESTVFLGVNNLHHLGPVREWETRANVFSFTDFFFYLANAAAVRFVLRGLSKIAFGYYWIEGTEADRVSLERLSGFPLFGAGNAFRPPYFLHRGDPEVGVLGFDRDETTGEKTFGFEYEKYRFEAVTKKGFTYIFPVPFAFP